MKILFFSPHAFYNVHALPEALVAETLAIKGHDIVSVNCNGLFAKHCLCMSHVPFSDDSSKKRVCAICKKCRDGINKEFSFRSIVLDNYVNVDEMALVLEAVRSLNRESFLAYSLEGIPVARYALYEFWLNHKLSSVNIPSAIWEEYLAIFKNTIATYFGIKRILEIEAPDRITTYNSLYGVNRITCAIADSMNIPHFTLHAGSHHKKRIQQMTIFKGIENNILVNRHPALAQYRENPCTLEQVKGITDHVTELFNATSPWVYSIKSDRLNSANLLKKLNISSDQKVLLAVMRSNDERLAAELAGIKIYDGRPIFNSQLDWLSWLSKFSKDNPNYAIIFRVHPREFPNKREQVTSQNAERLLDFIGKLDRPSNLYINLPSDKLSLHDLLKITDVLLNNSSTAGLEGALFGVPAIGIGDELFSFDRELQKEPDSIKSYVSLIEEAVSEEWLFSRVIMAYRWLNYINTEVAIDISDGYKVPFANSNRYIRFGRNVYRNMKLSLGASGAFPEVASRSRPMKNAELLAYAIINNLNSHIGVFSNTKFGDAAAEKHAVIKAYRQTMESVCAPDDKFFRAKYEACIESAH